MTDLSLSRFKLAMETLCEQGELRLSTELEGYICSGGFLTCSEYKL